MSKNSLELKDFVNDPTFIENMNRAFSDLRAARLEKHTYDAGCILYSYLYSRTQL